MSIEASIDNLTAAIVANTATLAKLTNWEPRIVEPKETEAPEKPAAKKAAKKKTAQKKEPAPTPPVEETPEETPEEDNADAKALVLKITELVKGKFMDKDRDTEADKAAFMELRESYNVERASEVPADKLDEFYDATVACLA
jgi:hypothetical protein